MADPNLGQIATVALRNRRSEVADDISNHNAVLAWAKRSGQLKTVEGGRTFVRPINFQGNGNAKWHAGGLDSWAINTESNIDAAEYARKFYAGFIYFTESERQANRGQAKVIDLVENKIKVLKATAANDFTTGIYNDGTTTNAILGLQAAVADDPTTGTYGSINSATYTWWRNQYKTGTTASANNIQTLLTDIWLSTIRGIDKPDLIVAGNNMFTYYFNSLTALQRFTTTDKADVLNFEGLAFQTAMILYDPGCNTKRMYGIDTKYLEIGHDPGRNWNVLEGRQVTNALYEVTPVAWSGFLGLTDRARHFVINGN